MAARAAARCTGTERVRLGGTLGFSRQVAAPGPAGGRPGQALQFRDGGPGYKDSDPDGSAFGSGASSASQGSDWLNDLL